MGPSQPLSLAAVLPTIIIILLILWPSICLYAKRWHDRDKSGWWSLIGMVPFVGSIWMLVECGLLAGTDGPNRIGNDPLENLRLLLIEQILCEIGRDLDGSLHQFGVDVAHEYRQ